MVFRAGQRDPRTWDVAWLSESVKIHSPAPRVFLRFPKLSQHPACMDHAILHGKPFSDPLDIAQSAFGENNMTVKIFCVCSSVDACGIKARMDTYSLDRANASKSTIVC